MARDGFDLSNLDAFTNGLIRSSAEGAKAQKKLLRDQGSKLARKTRASARAAVKRTAVKRADYDRAAGTYHKSIRRGKVYTKSGGQQIRVYSSDKIAHLIEQGWTPKLRGGQSGSHQRGKKVFESTQKDFEPEFGSACEEMVDEMIRKL